MEEQQSVKLCELNSGRDKIISEGSTTCLTHITGQQSLRYVFLHSFHLTASKKKYLFYLIFNETKETKTRKGQNLFFLNTFMLFF